HDLSLMRNAYMTSFVFIALVVLKHPNIKPFRRFAYCLCAILLKLYAFNRIPSVNRYRSPETISPLSDRTGLWRHLTAVTLDQSPWFGLGYYSASCIYGPDENSFL